MRALRRAVKKSNMHVVLLSLHLAGLDGLRRRAAPHIAVRRRSLALRCGAGGVNKALFVVVYAEADPAIWSEGHIGAEGTEPGQRSRECGIEGEYSTPQPTSGSGERRKLPQRGSGAPQWRLGAEPRPKLNFVKSDCQGSMWHVFH